MAGTIETSTGPTYISSRSADVILSDVRPIKLKLDALRALNVLLDEFLYNILNAAKCITTDKLKTTLIRILPTALGKEAILEAELELKAYWERTTPSPTVRDAGDTGQDFDLQWSFELLRLKCEAYTTLNDVDEDVEVETRLNDRMVNSGGSIPPPQRLLAPAALYLTAILEHICEHILSNTSRVTARDSSRTVSTVQDLFIALCEDDTIYGAFKTMKVYEQIESLSRARPPRRSASFSRNNGRTSSPSRVASPAIEVRESASNQERTRVSTESAISNAATNNTPPLLQRSSTEKSRVARILNRSSSDNGDKFETGPGEVRSFSGSSQTGHSPESTEDAALQDEFDELMRSGATMKVSLTPDRLRSMDVHKEGRRRLGQNGGTSPTSPDAKRGLIARKASFRKVDAIVEEGPQPAGTSAPSFAKASLRTRQGSLSQGQANSTSPLGGNPRARSISVSALSSSLRSKSDMPPPPLPSHVQDAPKLQKSASVQARMTGDGRPQRTRKIGRNRESLDIDAIMNGSDGEDTSDIHSLSSPTPSTTPRKPYISKAARELIDFLDEGPPEEPKLSPANASRISLESSKSKSNRFQRMVSRLAISNSKENLRSNSMDQFSPKTPRSTRSPYGSLGTSPPTSFQQTSLNSKRSMPTVVVATPPPPPSMFQKSNDPPREVTPPASSHASSEDVSVGSKKSNTPTRRGTVSRKAVPIFDEAAISQFPLPPARPDEIKKASLAKPVNGNGVGKLQVEENGTRQRKESSHKAESTKSSVKTDHGSERSDNVSPTTELLYHVPIRSSSRGVQERSAKPESQIPDMSKEQVKQDILKDPARTGIVLSSEDTALLRKVLAVATTADECRLLVEMFLSRKGSPLTSDRDGEQRSDSTNLPRRSEDALRDLIALNQDLERSLVGLLLSDEQKERTEANEAATPLQPEEVPLPLSAT